MHTLLLVILYLSLTNVASMRRIENRVGLRKELPVRLSHSQSHLPVWMDGGVEGERTRQRERERGEGGREGQKEVSYKFLNVTRRLH